MRIAIVGQQDFGKAVLEAFLARGDEVAGVFCAPEKAGAKADPLKVVAREKGLKTAITYWPVSVGAEADWVLGEIWDPDKTETVARLQAAATPGLLVELSFALGIPKEKIAEDKAAIDNFVSRAAAYVFRKYKPNLQLVHLLNVDDAQHKQGRDGDGVKEAVRRQDENLARIRMVAIGPHEVRVACRIGRDPWGHVGIRGTGHKLGCREIRTID